MPMLNCSTAEAALHDASHPAAPASSSPTVALPRSHHIGTASATSDISSRLLPTRDAAFYLSLAEKTLRNLRSRGGGPPFIRLLSGRIAYRVGDLDAWVSSRQFRSTSEY